jgi:membrane-bound metal-dependent hydrolase YbcI (DUF457 family)
MLSKTHIANSITIGLSFITMSKYYNLNYINHISYFEFIPGLIFGSIFPDIDTHKSWISQSIPFFDDKLRKLGFLKHRGLTHGKTGIIFAIFLIILIRNTFMIGFSTGYITHCIGDMWCSKLNITIKFDKFLYNIFWILNILLIILLISL